MTRLSAQERSDLYDSGFLDACNYPEKIIECLEFASDDPEFWAGWEKARDTHMLTPLIRKGLPTRDPSTHSPDAMMFHQAITYFELGFCSLETFQALPKLSQQQSEAFFSRMKEANAILKEAIGSFSTHYMNDWCAIDEKALQLINDSLRLIDTIPECSVRHPVLSRPSAPRLDRNFVTSDTIGLARIYGYPSYATIASIINAIFPTYEPIDAGYVQAVARKKKKVVNQ